MLVPALLIAVWTGVCTFDLFGPQLSLWRPMFSSAITGLLLGDFTQGLILGAAFELMWLGVVGVGAYVPPDVVTGAIVGTAVGIMSKQGAELAIAIAVPVAIVAQQLDMLARTVAMWFTHQADKRAATGDFDKASRYHLMCLPFFLLTRMVPVFLAVFLGAPYVEAMFSSIPGFILTGLSVAGGLLPALGFGMLLSMMLNKKLWIFLILGFVLNVYMGVPTIGLALVGIIMAVLYDQFTEGGAGRGNDKKSAEEAVPEGGYDL